MDNIICIKPNIFEITEVNITKYFNAILKKFKIFKTKESRYCFIKLIVKEQVNKEYNNLTKLYEVIYYCVNLLKLFHNYDKFNEYVKLFIITIFFHQLKIDNSIYFKNSKQYDIEVDIIENNFNTTNENTLILSKFLFDFKSKIRGINIEKKNYLVFINNIILASNHHTHAIFLEQYDKYVELISNDTISIFNKPVVFFSLILKCALCYNPIDNFSSHSNWILRYYNQQNIGFKSINKISEAAIHIINTYNIPLFNQLNKLKKNNYVAKLFLVIEEWKNLQTKDYHKKCNIRHSLDVCSKHNIIDTLCDIELSGLQSTVCTTHHVCICMIDICNFSQWCANQVPEKIFKTMTKFNEFLNIFISEYEDVTKVELVGDSVLIVGGLYYNDIQHLTTTSMMNIAMNIINSSKQIETIFQDSNVGVRIGIHNGSVYSGFIENPTKYQLFGNTINVASRLESTAVQNTINISSETMLILKHNTVSTDIFDKIEIGKTNKLWLKGVGIYNTHLCFLKRNIILIADDTESFCFIMKHYIRKLNYETEIVRTLEDVFTLLKRNIYTCVFLDRNFENENVKERLKQFRIWEQSIRTSIQKIYLISSFEENEAAEKIEYIQLCEEIFDKSDPNFYKNISNIITTY